jgi:hypothetical protein
MLYPFSRAAGLLRFAQDELTLRAHKADPESAVRILNLHEISDRLLAR